MTAVLGTRPDQEKPRMKKPGRWSAPPRPVCEEEQSPAGKACKGFALGLACLAILFPLWIVIVTSLQTKKTS
ncbi:carbohydrate ABC transporter permease, partial [Streptomyces sp. NPDC057062]